MNAKQAEPAKFPVTSFRTKLLVAMMLVVSGVTVLALYFAQRNVAENVERDLQREFEGELAALHRVQEIRHGALVERCRQLVRKPRIHAALEDGGLDLLYSSAKDELVDLMNRDDDANGNTSYALHALFYRFLDRNGELIAAPSAKDTGTLQPAEEARLALHAMPHEQNLGYLPLASIAGNSLSEVIAMPVVSTETGEAIAAIVLGFKPVPFVAARRSAGIKSGVWVEGQLHLATLTAEERTDVSAEMARALGATDASEGSFGSSIAGQPHRIFFKQLNPNSLFPPAYEVCVYPLVELVARQRQLAWQVIAAGGLLLLAGWGASHVISRRFSEPVEKLATDSADNFVGRQKAEAALEMTAGELQRAARFSADASHQLKTPVTVLRAGLEELLAQDNLTPEECQEISALIHQTYRLSSVIEDLLLLSRMDAGRLKIEVSAVDLSQLIEASLDDLGALPDTMHLTISTDFPANLHVAGEKRYLTLILQNLLENARKYNRHNGRIRISARENAGSVILTIGNTGKPITPDAQAHIFERFHRGTMGENVEGYGLGLNLARELARLHQGELRLVLSDESWTEFELRLRSAQPAPLVAAQQE